MTGDEEGPVDPAIYAQVYFGGFKSSVEYADLISIYRVLKFARSLNPTCKTIGGLHFSRKRGG